LKYQDPIIKQSKIMFFHSRQCHARSFHSKRREREVGMLLTGCMAEAGAALFPASTSEEMARMKPWPF
jgi:hypothetical protein